MIEFYVTAVTAKSDSHSSERVKSVKALRSAREALRELDPTLNRALADVRALASGADSVFVGSTENRDFARRVPAILNEAFEWHWINTATGEDSRDRPSPKVHWAPAPLPEPETPEQALARPDYPETPKHVMTAMLCLALAHGNGNEAMSTAHSFGRILADDPAEGHPTWNAALKVLLDTFPLTGPGVEVQTKDVAKKVGGGGY